MDICIYPKKVKTRYLILDLLLVKIFKRAKNFVIGIVSIPKIFKKFIRQVPSNHLKYQQKNILHLLVGTHNEV